MNSLTASHARATLSFLLLAGVTLACPAVASSQAPFTSIIPGIKTGGSTNVHALGHLPLDGNGRTADITIEQELSRPYVYIAHRGTPSGVEIISIKDPTRPKLIWSWYVPNADLHMGAGALNPIYLKSHGRYYLTNSYQFIQGGPDVDLGATVWDVTGLPDTSKIKFVAEIRDPDHPNGFHESYAYKHSNGQALLLTAGSFSWGAAGTKTDKANDPYADVWDIDQVATAGRGDPHTGLVARVPIPVRDTVMTEGGPRAPGYHDFYVAYDPATHQDKFYGAGLNGYYVYDITDLKNPKLLTSLTGIAGVTRGHTFVVDPTGRYAVVETEYQYAPLRLFDLQPGLDGTVSTISRPIGAWTADWRDLSHNMEIRWPYVFVSAYLDGFQVFNMMDPTSPYTVGYYYTCDCPSQGGMGGTWGVQVRNADGLIVMSDGKTGFWALKMDGFDGWNGHQWGVPNVSSAQDWDNGPEGAPKAGKVS